MITRSDLESAAGMCAVHASESIFRGARAFHGPTRALADLWTVYQAAWPRTAADLFLRDWKAPGR